MYYPLDCVQILVNFSSVHSFRRCFLVTPKGLTETAQSYKHVSFIEMSVWRFRFTCLVVVGYSLFEFVQICISIRTVEVH